MMEWNAFQYSLEANAPPHTYWFNWDADQGRVFTEARQFSNTGGNTLMVTGFGTNRRLDLGGNMFYFVIIENIGPEKAFFELVGVNFP